MKMMNKVCALVLSVALATRSGWCFKARRR